MLDHIWKVLNAGDYQRTLELLNECVEISDDWYLIQARAYHGLGRTREAEKSFANIKNSARTVVRVAEARLFQDLRQYKKAVELYQAALKRENDDPYKNNEKNIKRIKDILMSLARCYEEMGEYQLALDQYKTISIANHGRDVVIAVSRLIANTGQSQLAINKLKSKSGWESDKESILCLAYILRSMHQYDEALKLYDDKRWLKHPDIAMARAHCLRDMGRYAEAIQTLYAVPCWDQNENVVLDLSCALQDNNQPEESLKVLKEFESLVLRQNQTSQLSRQLKLAIARAYQLMGGYGEALTCCDNILKEYPADKEALLAKGYCLTEQHQFDIAISVFGCIANVKNDKNVFIGVTNAYIQQGKYVDAYTLFRGDHPWKKDKHVLLSEAMCLRKMGKFSAAIDIYDTLISLFKNDASILIAKARCDAEMGNFTSAFSTFSEMENREQDRQIVLSESRCYQEIGDDESALSVLKKNSHWQQDKQLLLSVARLYRLQKNYQAALAIYLKNVPRHHNRKRYTTEELKSTDKSIIINLSCCHEEMGEYELALSACESIPNWRQDKSVFKTYMHVLEIKRDYQQALFVYDQSPFKNDKDALLNKAFLYYKMDQYDKVKLTFQQIASHFPDSGDVRYCKCLIALNYDDADAEKMINKLIIDYPYLPQAQLLKAKLYLKFNMLIAAIAKLQETGLQFPYYSAGYYELLNVYLLKCDADAVKKLQQFCLTWFPGHQKLANRMEKLIKSAAIAGQFQDNFEVDLEEKVAVASPTIIADLFKYLGAVPNLYLTGGTVLNLLAGEPLASNQNFDFVGLDTKDARIKLVQAGFSASPHIPGLYVLQNYPYSTDVFLVKSAEKNPKNFRYKKMYFCDFTVCSLFYDGKDIRDPSGLGIDDAKQKILRTIGNPVIRLQEDPIILLRAMMYMVKGYTPTDGLNDAILNWQSHSMLPMGHLQAVARKHLMKMTSEDKIKYINLLIKHGLYSKIFNLTPAKTAAASLLKLEIAIGLQLPGSVCFSETLFYPSFKNANLPLNPRNATDLTARSMRSLSMDALGLENGSFKLYKNN